MTSTHHRASIVVTFVGLVVLAAACSPPEPAESASPPLPVIERPFGQGGKLTMRLSAGQYTIENAPGEHIPPE